VNPWEDAIQAMKDFAAAMRPLVDDAKDELRRRGIEPDDRPDYPVLDQLADLEAGKFGRLA
jgi:hypothetical protein